jgi:hypothetical protein
VVDRQCQLFSDYDHGGEIRIGRAVAIVASSLQVPEPSRIVIGDESGVGAESWISTSDMHPIYSPLTGRRRGASRSERRGKRCHFAPPPPWRVRALLLRLVKLGTGILTGGQAA